VSPAPQAVHPHQPRFAQGITGLLAVMAIAAQQWPIILIALGLVLVALLAPGVSPVGWLFRRIARPASELEPVAPVRFSQWLAVAFLTVAAGLHLAGLPLYGWIVTGLVAAVALISAISGYCIGCEVYRLLLGRGSAADDLRGPLGLTGQGPWLAVLTAPGCARCGPTVERVKAAAKGRAVSVVNLAERPSASRAPIKSIPAVLAIAADGTLLSARAGVIDDAEIAELLQEPALA
jgi:hypothetical protein